MPNDLLAFDAALRAHWTLDPETTFLNHGSFGATPRVVQAAQAEWRSQLEAQPVAFFVRTLPRALDTAREALGSFLCADAERLAFVPNATAGVNTVLRSVAPSWAPGGNVVTTNHEYNACRNALEFVADGAGLEVRVARVPFPLDGPDEAFEAVMACVDHATRLVLVDHVTSPTGLVLPVQRLVAALRDRGVPVLIDGAHAPGMLDLDLEALGADYYTGNLHKWVCAPKGAAFLHARADRVEALRPLAISHGANAALLPGQTRFRVEFDWTGTADPTAFLSVPEAIRFVGGLLPGGWSAVRARNHALCLAARDQLCDALGLVPPAPDVMLGTLASLPVPPTPGLPPSPHGLDALQEALWVQHRIEVPIVPWGGRGEHLVRISAHLHNGGEDYERLARALRLISAIA
jgi:isopenicillin-N epimerase